jgi:hypothetical protein
MDAFGKSRSEFLPVIANKKTMKFNLYFCALPAAVCFGCGSDNAAAAPAPEASYVPEGYALAWSDEFDYVRVYQKEL